VQEIEISIHYKSMVLFMQKKANAEYASGARETFLSSHSIMFENTLLANRRNITFIIDLVLFWSLNHMFHRIDNGTRVKNDDLDISCAILGCQ